MKNSRILVTGASGAIGGALRDIASSEFPERNFIFSTTAECDLTDALATLKYVSMIRPDAIIHLAAAAGGVGINKTHPASLLRDNVRMSINILEAARICDVGKTVMTLSSGIYPKQAPLPLEEKSLHDGYPDESNYGYAFAKRLIDPMIKAYRDEFGMAVIGLLPNNVIGERSSFREADSGVVPALIKRFFENRAGDAKLVVWGDGSPLREISYAKDIARIFMWSLDHYDNNQVLNVGTSEEISVADIAFAIADTMDISRERIIFDSSKPTGPKRKNTNKSRFSLLYPHGYAPIREAIIAVTTHFMEESARNTGSLRL